MKSLILLVGLMGFVVPHPFELRADAAENEVSCNPDGSVKCPDGFLCNGKILPDHSIKYICEALPEDSYRWNNAPADFLKARPNDYIVKFLFIDGDSQLFSKENAMPGFQVIYRTKAEKKFITNLVNEKYLNKFKRLQSFAVYAGHPVYDPTNYFAARPLLTSGDTFPEVCDGIPGKLGWGQWNDWAKNRALGIGLSAAPERSDLAPWFCPWGANPYLIMANGKQIWKSVVPVK